MWLETEAGAAQASKQTGHGSQAAANCHKICISKVSGGCKTQLRTTKCAADSFGLQPLISTAHAGLNLAAISLLVVNGPSPRFDSRMALCSQGSRMQPAWCSEARRNKIGSRVIGGAARFGRCGALWYVWRGVERKSMALEQATASGFEREECWLSKWPWVLGR